MWQCVARGNIKLICQTEQHRASAKDKATLSRKYDSRICERLPLATRGDTSAHSTLCYLSSMVWLLSNTQQTHKHELRLLWHYYDFITVWRTGSKLRTARKNSKICEAENTSCTLFRAPQSDPSLSKHWRHSCDWTSVYLGRQWRHSHDKTNQTIPLRFGPL